MEDGRMQVQTDGRRYGWLDSRTAGWMDGQADGRTDGRMEGRTDGCKYRQPDAGMDDRTAGRTDERTDGRTAGQADRRTPNLHADAALQLQLELHRVGLRLADDVTQLADLHPHLVDGDLDRRQLLLLHVDDEQTALHVRERVRR